VRRYSWLITVVLGACSCTSTPRVDNLPIHIVVWTKRIAPPAKIVDAFVDVTNRGAVPLTECWIAVDNYKKHFQRLEPGVTLTIPAEQFVWEKRSSYKLRLASAHVNLLQAHPSQCAEGIGPPRDFVVERSSRPYS
jgi:hypothetical protein